MKKEEAKQKIKLLIDKFTSQFEYYKSLNYNEMQTRQDFINPFFKALGWDIDNTKQQLETYRDVKHEDKVKINGHTKAPDYSFNIEGKRKFFVEAKKPSISIKENPEPALQVRSYGWNANLSISILIDFEELAIYNCTKKPKIIENANAKRLKYIYYTDYLKEFDFIYDTFAYENVLAGSIEAYAKSKIDFKTAEPVNEEFLKSIETWRQYLATTIVANNKNIEDENINFAVQQTIDRIVFLKVCEDRKIEKENSLFRLIKSGDYYQNLYAYFQIADQKYNSGLFDFKKDTITQNLKIENKVIKNIITELYGKTKENEKEYGYNFAIIPVEILGLAYEQFLGKVVKINASKNAQIEEKPEVRKAGGVYYTPEYIVEYIVKNTLGKLIENKKPEEISKIKVLDPSCGSGSFLLGAYQYLLDYHLKYYDKNRSKLKMYNNPLTPDGNLTSQEKKRILLNNIFGVDIDTQAVEVSKLSLLLKALEGETEASIQTSLQLIHERVLPTIDSNVRSGNSLISPDFYNEGLFLTPKEERKINVFDWKIGFADVFKQGGFDCVIGNPPYVTIGGKEDTMFVSNEVEYLLKNYLTKEYKPNLWAYFYEKGYNLLKNNGVVSYIVPRTFIDNVHYNQIRSFFATKSEIIEISKLNYEVFEQATTGGSSICIFKKSEIIDNEVDLFTFSSSDDFIEMTPNSIQVPQKNILISENNFFNFQDKITNSLFEKISKKGILLGEICSVNNGVNTGNAANILLSKKKKNEKYLKIIEGKDINRYAIHWNNNWINYDSNLKKTISLSDLKTKQNKVDFALRDYAIFSNPKIIIRQTSDKIIACYDDNLFITRHSTHCILPIIKNLNLKYILGILNSKLLNFYYQTLIPEKGKVFAEVKALHAKKLPIKTIDFNNKIEKQQHDKLVKLVENMLELNKRLQNSTIQTEKEQLQQRIEYTDIEINQLVYELYEITEQSEIDIIEQKNA
ncbi:MAG: restriction endonuclease subunit M [Cytophagia bacterium]|nr:MAG: restriction endonuclease subunit M [Cytophagia bacterium]